MRQVTAAVIVEDGRLLLARRAPGEKLAGLWELPGGKLEDCETPQDCLSRELAEEMDMLVNVGEVIASTVYQYEHGRFELLALRATRLSEFSLTVHDAVAWVSREHLHEHPLAPADIDLIRCLEELGVW